MTNLSHISIQFNGFKPPGLTQKQIKVFVKDILLEFGSTAGLGIKLVSNEDMIVFNSTYRNKNRTTDVLSFPHDWDAMYEEEYLGDIVISYPQAKTQSIQMKQTITQEILFLSLHGILHLLGYDHEKDNGEMMNLQKDLQYKFLSKS